MIRVGQFMDMFKHEMETWKARHGSREERNQVSLFDPWILRTILHEFLIFLVVFEFGAVPLLRKGVMLDVRFVVALKLECG